jgi:tetratricopeptide (TPR) repeat protein
MSILGDLRNQQRIRAAEGYLDLIMVFSDRWPPSLEVRSRVANRCLEILEEVDDEERYRGQVSHLRGQALRAMERYRDAVVSLQQAADLDPDNIQVHLALGWCHKRIGRLDLAIQALEDAMEVAPDEGIIHYNLACYWSLAHNKGLALQYLTQSFDLDPNYRDLVADESDFDSLRDDPDFQSLTNVIV